MTWHELTRDMAAATGQTHKAAMESARALFDAIARAARGGERVDVPGFGVFVSRSRKPRRVRNVRDGEEMYLPRIESLGFRAAKAQKRRGP